MKSAELTGISDYKDLRLHIFTFLHVLCVCVTDFQLPSGDLHNLTGFTSPGGGGGSLLSGAWPGSQGPLSAAVQAAGINHPG